MCCNGCRGQPCVALTSVVSMVAGGIGPVRVVIDMFEWEVKWNPGGQVNNGLTIWPRF